jgi:copper(I)-binding protein
MMKWWMTLALLATPTLAFAQDPGPRVEQAWARATPGGSASTGAAYATIETASPDKLVGASTPIAGRAELHEHVDQGGVMRMRSVDAVPVRPGTPTVLKPGGLHVMLMELKRPLKEGDSFPMSFVFEKAGVREVTVRVERAGAMGPPSGEHRHGPHGGGASAKSGA